MDPSLGIMLLVACFVATHLGLATLPVRTRLVGWLGESGFRVLFLLVAATSLAVLTVYYADHRLDGPPGPALGAVPLVRPVLVALVGVGMVLMVATFATYGGSPYDVDHPDASRPPRGLERVTRHPFFAGLALFAGAHALLATRLVASIAMLGLALLAIVGARHQDAKLLRLRGPAFARYLATTSAVPFAAILAGRQPFPWREVPGVWVALGVTVTLLLRQIHADIFADRGVWALAVGLGGPTILTAVTLVHERRRRRSAARAPHDTGARVRSPER